MAGKHMTPKKRHWAPFVVVLAVAALVATIGGTMAWLTTKSDTDLVNTFTPAEVEIKVVETVKDNKKTSIAVQNIGDADAYVRVTLVSNWGKMIDDNWVVCGDVSHNHGNFTFDDTTLGDDWTKLDGYYYYTSPVEPGEDKATKNLLPADKVIELSGDEDGCKQQVTVLAQAVQAEGEGKNAADETKKPVELAWGIDPADLAAGN